MGMPERIRVDQHAVGAGKRTGEIVEMLGAPGHPRYRVRWEDGHESIIAPGSDASLSLPEPPRRGRRKPAAGAKPAARPQPTPTPRLRAARGDRLVVRAHRVGEPERDAEILEALGADGTPPFRVRWTDTGREGSLFPGPDAYVEHLVTPRSRRPQSRRPAGG
jgi:hypothetical protein